MNEVNMGAMAQETINLIDDKKVVGLNELMNKRVYSWGGLK